MEAIKAEKSVKKASLFLSVVFMAACVSFGGSKKDAAAASIYGEVIAKPGESEIIVENTLQSQLNIFIDGKLENSVKARGAIRLVVPDGNHNIKVQNTAKKGGMSKDVQFYTKSKRVYFRATEPAVSFVSLNRENVYDITAPNSATATGTADASDGSTVSGGGDGGVPLSETALGKDKAAFFERMDNQVPAPSSNVAPAASAPQPQPLKATAPAASQQNAASPVGGSQSTNSPPKQKSQIAVYVTGDKNESERKALGTKLQVALVNSGRYIAVERFDDFLSAIEKEHVKQRDNSVDDNQISAVGRQFGVQYICIANIAEAFGAYQVSARIINIETAVVVAVGESSSALRSMDDLTSVSARVAGALLKE